MNLPIPNKDAYLKAYPFPHLVIDNFFDEWKVRDFIREWPKMGGGFSRVGTTNENDFGAWTAAHIKTAFHSQKFIGFLEQLTGINGLVLDSREIGLHEVFNGGHQDSHLDYTINERTGLQHRVNAILYLNEGWKEQYGGWLELGKDDYGSTFDPIFNRLIIFAIDDQYNPWHGVSKVECPKWMSRKSIALNYFSAPQANAVYIPTTYKTKNSLIKQFIPPVLWRILK